MASRNLLAVADHGRLKMAPAHEPKPLNWFQQHWARRSVLKETRRELAAVKLFDSERTDAEKLLKQIKKSKEDWLTLRGFRELRNTRLKRAQSNAHDVTYILGMDAQRAAFNALESVLQKRWREEVLTKLYIAIEKDHSLTSQQKELASIAGTTLACDTKRLWLMDGTEFQLHVRTFPPHKSMLEEDLKYVKEGFKKAAAILKETYWRAGILNSVRTWLANEIERMKLDEKLGANIALEILEAEVAMAKGDGLANKVSLDVIEADINSAIHGALRGFRDCEDEANSGAKRVLQQLQGFLEREVWLDYDVFIEKSLVPFRKIKCAGHRYQKIDGGDGEDGVPVKKLGGTNIIISKTKDGGEEGGKVEIVGSEALAGVTKVIPLSRKTERALRRGKTIVRRAPSSIIKVTHDPAALRWAEERSGDEGEAKEEK